MARSLRELEASAPPLADSQSFSSWMAEQREAVSALREEEARRRRAALLAACEKAVHGTGGDVDIAFARLRATAPDSLTARLYMELRDGRYEPAVLLAEKASLTEENRLGMEIAFSAYLDTAPEKTKERLYQLFSTFPSQGTLGETLRLTLAGDTGRKAEVLQRWDRRLDEANGPSAGVLRDRLEGGVLPREQFNARVWRVPIPSFADTVGRVLQWQEDYASGRDAMQSETGESP